MPKKTFTPEQVVGKLQQIEVLVSQGNPARGYCSLPADQRIALCTSRR